MRQTNEKRNSDDEEDNRRFTGNSIPEYLLTLFLCVLLV